MIHLVFASLSSLGLALAAPSTPPPHPQLDAAQSPWRVACAQIGIDHMRCSASRALQDGTTPFAVFFEDSQGPFLQIGHQTYPGRGASLQIDDGPAQPAIASAEVIAALSQGRRARVQYYTWPSGQRSGVLELDGFGSAYLALERLALGDESAPTTP